MQIYLAKEYILIEPQNDEEVIESFLQILTQKNAWIPSTAQKCIGYLDLVLNNERIPSEVKKIINGEIQTLFIFLSSRTKKQEIESQIFKAKFQLAINAVIYNLQEYYKIK